MITTTGRLGRVPTQLSIQYICSIVKATRNARQDTAFHRPYARPLGVPVSGGKVHSSVPRYLSEGQVQGWG